MNTKEKRDVFEIFYMKSKPWFRFIHAKDISMQRISRYYGFCICPGGDKGEEDSRIIDVFWGNRPFGKIKRNRGNGRSTAFLAENGAKLNYQLLDSGNVLVSLAPAKTKHLGPIEEFIFVSVIKNPKKLLKINYIRRHWVFIKAYMNITAFEGNKNIKDKLVTFYLRNFKYTICGGRQIEPKIWTALKNLLKFIFTVGLSGFLILTIMSIKECNNKNDNNSIEIIESINRVNSNQADILFKIGDINNKLNDIYSKIIDNEGINPLIE